MQNIEFKAELRDLPAARRQCSVLGAKRIGTLRQTDTYFRLSDGRLKRREYSADPGNPGNPKSPGDPGAGVGEPVEWVFYHRQDRVTPKMSNYSILTEEQARRRWGTHSLRDWVTVMKTRELWMRGGVRIHLDSVDQLGTFIEFEALVSPQLDVKACHAAIAELRRIFGPTLGEPISASYSDLMAQLLAEKSNI